MTPYFRGALAAPHGFFTREGGVSQGVYSSLNCGLFGQDDAAHVAENRSRAALAIGAMPSNLLGLKQVHGPRVVTARTPWTSGDGVEADAMVTDRLGIALGIITGDCAPVLFADARSHIVGAAHAGWRGAVAGVLEATADAMRALGAHDITAVIGPCIHQASYEVGEDLRDAVVGRDKSDRKFFVSGRPNHWFFDLPGYCAERLAAARVETSILPHDTYADEARFFSHRRRTLRAEGPGGLQISIIMRAP